MIHLDGSHQNVRLLHLSCAESLPVGTGIQFHKELAIKHSFEEKNMANDLLKNLEEKTITSSYLIKIADNLIKRRYNKDQRKNQYIESQREEAIRDLRRHQKETPEWTNTEISKALDNLPTHERDAVRLVVCEGLSYEEASESLGVPVSTVNNWKYRGINKLKDCAAEMENRYIA